MTNLDEANKPDALTEEELTRMESSAEYFVGCNDINDDLMSRDILKLIAELRRLRAQPTIRDLTNWIQKSKVGYWEFWLLISILANEESDMIYYAKELLKQNIIKPYITAAADCDNEKALSLLEEEVAKAKENKP